MKKRLGDFSQRKVWLVLSLSITVAYMVFFFVTLTMKFVVENDILHYVLAIVLSLLVIATSFATSSYFVRREKLNSLRKDNNYHLGVDNYFYDYALFEERVKILRKRTNKRVNAQNCICFKAVHARNEGNNDPTIKILNAKIADYLDQTLLAKTGYGPNKTVFCFHRNNFYIFCFFSIEQCQALIEEIQKAIFDIIENYSIRVYAYPNFGVSVIGKDKSVAEAVDKATIAREYADKHFEDVTYYKDELRETTSIEDINEIKRAIDRKEFVVYYQPKFHLKQKKFVGSEALIRWNSPRRGLIPPAQFIKKAEDGGLIHEIDMYVFNQVLDDLKAQKMRGERLLPVSINFSWYEFYGPNFIEDLVAAIDRAGLPRRLVEIEITETTSQANPFTATIVLKRLKEAGFKILMDDFGSGYSNLTQLNNLPIDVVKIDKSFIDGIQGSQKNKDIVQFLIALCRDNGFEVIAEGVDGKEEVQILEKAKCDAIQGYYYSKPLPLKEYLRFLQENKFEKREGK